MFALLGIRAIALLPSPWFDNLVSLIFQRRISRRTSGRSRTRVITPSLHIDDKSTRIRQYFKEQRALRTETTINDARDVGLGRRLCNLPALRAIGFAANRPVLEVERISQDCRLAAATKRLDASSSRTTTWRATRSARYA